MNDTLDRVEAALADRATANAIRDVLYAVEDLTGTIFPEYEIDTFRGESNAWIVMADGTEITLAADMSTGATLVAYVVTGPDGRITATVNPTGTITAARHLAATLTGTD